MTPITQENRLLQIATPLGTDVLLLTALSGREEISRLFSYQLEMLSEEDSIAAKDIVGKNVTFNVALADGEPRYFNGFVSRFSAGSREGGLRRYRAEVVPWLWFLTRTADCRVFQNKKIPEIIEQIFSDLGFSDFETSEIKGEHEPWDYCVQFRETDFNFVSRLMEQEGIFYYFKHEDGKHTLVLADQKGAHKDCPENEVEYEGSYSSQADQDRITSWEHQYEFTPGKWSQTDYNFKDHPARGESTPSKLLMTSEPTTVDLDNIDQYEMYDYPGEYPDKGRGQAYTKIRMEEEEAAHDTVQGASTCKTFTPGGKFKITRHDCEAEQGKAYVLTSVEHSATEPAEYEGPGGGIGEDYSNTFTCIPDSVTFRPPRITPKPVVHGVLTAVVTGPAGEEIWPDEYGRVKVQFFFDREGTRDENSSCWVRVSQTYAGKNWGSMSIPRIEQEVIVDFVEGDPDRPIITGRVYNAEQMPPFDLPGKKVVTGFKSNSSPGGGGYNEISADDTKGNEKITIHGQYDMNTTVEHDQTTTVHNNRTDKIDVNDSETVGGNQVLKVDGTKQTTVTKAVTETYNDTQTTTVDKTISITSSTADVKVTAATEIKLEVGASSLLMKSDGTIILSGKDVSIIGSATVKAAAPSVAATSEKEVMMGVGTQTVTCNTSKVESAGAGITSAAVGVHEISGALVKIN